MFEINQKVKIYNPFYIWLSAGPQMLATHINSKYFFDFSIKTHYKYILTNVTLLRGRHFIVVNTFYDNIEGRFYTLRNDNDCFIVRACAIREVI